MSAYPFIIGVLSDTHGNRRLMYQAADCLVRDFGAAVLIHLGDNYEDAEELEAIGYSVFKVPGLWCPEYRNHRIPRVQQQRFGWASIIAAHADQDLPGNSSAQISLAGHTHRAEITPAPYGFHLNPGHLKAGQNRGERASFGLIQVEAQAIRAAIHERDGALRTAHRFTRKKFPGVQKGAEK